MDIGEKRVLKWTWVKMWTRVCVCVRVCSHTVKGWHRTTDVDVCCTYGHCPSGSHLLTIASPTVPAFSLETIAKLPAPSVPAGRSLKWELEARPLCWQSRDNLRYSVKGNSSQFLAGISCPIPPPPPDKEQSSSLCFACVCVKSACHDFILSSESYGPNCL